MGMQLQGPLALVVEDDPTTCDVLCELLGEEGYQVLQTGSRSVALRLARQYQPAVLLLDLMLGGEHASSSGALELLALLKSQPATRDVRVVALGSAPSGERVAGLERADAVLPKPFALSDVLRVLVPDEPTPDGQLRAAWAPG